MPKNRRSDDPRLREARKAQAAERYELLEEARKQVALSGLDPYHGEGAALANELRDKKLQEQGVQKEALQQKVKEGNPVIALIEGIYEKFKASEKFKAFLGKPGASDSFGNKLLELLNEEYHKQLAVYEAYMEEKAFIDWLKGEFGTEARVKAFYAQEVPAAPLALKIPSVDEVNMLNALENELKDPKLTNLIAENNKLVGNNDAIIELAKSLGISLQETAFFPLKDTSEMDPAQGLAYLHQLAGAIIGNAIDNDVPTA